MYKVSFEFDPESEAVYNVKVVKTASKFETIDLPVVELGDSKLIMSPKAISLLKASVGDRISVNYIQKSNECTFPVIGKSEVFTDKNAGNKLTKTNTVSFRGTQKTILTEYGTLFELSEYKPGMFKMTQIDSSRLETSNSDLEEENHDLSLI